MVLTRTPFVIKSLCRFLSPHRLEVGGKLGIQNPYDPKKISLREVLAQEKAARGIGITQRVLSQSEIEERRKEIEKAGEIIRRERSN